MRPATTCARSPHAGPMSVAFGLSYAAVGKSLHTHAAHAQGHGPTDSSAQRSRLCSVPPATTAIVQRAPCRYTGNWVFSSQLSLDRKSTRLNSSHVKISYAVFCLKKKKKKTQ